MIAPCGFLEDELRSYSKEERVTMADSVETIGGGLENERQEVGSERKSEVGEVQGEVLAYEEEQGLPKELHEGRGQEVVTSGYDANEDVGSACSGFGPNGEIEIEETDVSSSGQKECDLVVPFDGGLWS